MELPATAEGRQGKCPSCDAVVTITAPQDTDRSASEVQVSTEQTTTAPASPQAAQRVQQKPAAVVAKPTPQPTLKPRKSRWKLLCVTHILAVALTIGLMPYWKPHLEPLFPDDYLVQNTSGADGRELQTLDEFGRAVLAAVQAKNPEPFFELGLEYEDFHWINDRILNAIEDPLKKARHESKKPAVTKKEVERGKTEWRRLVLEFFTLVENGEAVLTFEQLKKAKYLGMAGSENKRETESINEETGVSLDDIGVIMIDMPGIYIGVQGRVYLIGLNEVLMHLNGHWRLSGDIKLGLGFLFDRRFDMDEISFVGSLAGKREVFERMNRYLSDQPVPPQEHEQRIIDNRKPQKYIPIPNASSSQLINGLEAPADTAMMLPGMIDPVTLAAKEAQVDVKELVIGITVGDVHRAYIVHAFVPLGQKVINDLINEIPISVTYCDIYERARVFTSTERGEYLHIGLGGWMNKEMFFYFDNIRFSQSSENAPLPDYPYIITTWGEWLEVHPDSRIYLGDGVIPDDNLSFDADP